MVRLIGAAVLRREAMGFGDVTLMAMIGAFLGWQPCLMIFFIGPFFGLLPAIIMRISGGRWHREIPYGPFLCLGAMTVLIFWADLWMQFEDLFGMGWLVPAFVVAMGPLMAAVLALLQLIKWLVRTAGQRP